MACSAGIVLGWVATLEVLDLLTPFRRPQIIEIEVCKKTLVGQNSHYTRQLSYLYYCWIVGTKTAQSRVRQGCS